MKTAYEEVLTAPNNAGVELASITVKFSKKERLTVILTTIREGGKCWGGWTQDAVLEGHYSLDAQKLKMTSDRGYWSAFVPRPTMRKWIGTHNPLKTRRTHAMKHLTINKLAVLIRRDLHKATQESEANIGRLKLDGFQDQTIWNAYWIAYGRYQALREVLSYVQHPYTALHESDACKNTVPSIQELEDHFKQVKQSDDTMFEQQDE
jgi:hypothetical protein